jgi:MerR family transcriptional regulator, light-induced transcriptional regulator
MFTIKAVSQATGVSIETLRAWERRYRVVEPHRDPNGRRSYSPPDVIRLRKLREATERGHAISKLSRFSDDELASVLATPANEGPARAAAKSFSAQLVDAAEDYRPDDCDQALSMALALLPIEDVVTSVLAPTLIEVGERWHAGQFNVAQERIVTSAVRRQVGAVLDTYNKISSSDPIVFATLPDERHELGLLMSALIAASKGMRCHYLGTEVPAADIAMYASRVGASAIVLSFVLHDARASVVPALTDLALRTPNDVRIWVGGRASDYLELASLGNRVTRIPDYTVFHTELDALQAAER